MEFVFKTSDNLYAINRSEDKIWTEIFGDGIVEYTVCKYNYGLATILGMSGWYILWRGESLKDCFDYLVRKNIIKKSEAKDAFETLTEQKK